MQQYSDERIMQDLHEYRERVDRVMEVMRLYPLNEHSISRVVHSSGDFIFVQKVHQQNIDGMLIGMVEEDVVVPRKGVLNANPDMSEDQDLYSLFTQMPLDVEKNPFVLVGYDDGVKSYLEAHTDFLQDVTRAQVRKTAQGVPFYFTSENEINGEAPVRARLEEGLALLILE